MKDIVIDRICFQSLHSDTWMMHAYVYIGPINVYNMIESASFSVCNMYACSPFLLVIPLIALLSLSLFGLSLRLSPSFFISPSPYISVSSSPFPPPCQLPCLSPSLSLSLSLSLPLSPQSLSSVSISVSLFLSPLSRSPTPTGTCPPPQFRYRSAAPVSLLGRIEARTAPSGCEISFVAPHRVSSSAVWAGSSNSGVTISNSRGWRLQAFEVNKHRTKVFSKCLQGSKTEDCGCLLLLVNIVEHIY